MQSLVRKTLEIFPDWRSHAQIVTTHLPILCPSDRIIRFLFAYLTTTSYIFAHTLSRINLQPSWIDLALWDLRVISSQIQVWQLPVSIVLMMVQREVVLTWNLKSGTWREPGSARTSDANQWIQVKKNIS